MDNIKRRTRKWPLLVSALCVALATAALAAPTVKRWLFKDKNEMEQTVRQYADNPRATYYIITRAHKRNLAAQAAVVYRKMLEKQPHDPYLQSAYAFSHFMATGVHSREFTNEKASVAVRQLRKQTMDAAYYREEALKSKPDSSVILVESALFLSADGQDRAKAVELLRRAVKRNPKWADAQYWLGNTLCAWWSQQRQHREEIGKEALVHLREAERLEPKLRPECLISSVYAYQALGDKPKQLQYMEAYLKARPEATKEEWLVKWRKSLKDDLAKQKKPGA